MEVRKRFENDKLKKLQIFNGAQLKYIAFISMLIDHVNNALITPFLNGKGFLLHLSNLFSILGRIAFPIFVFFIVEGFFKTSNRKKYLITLLLFGVISEVPFDMFTSKVFFDPYWNNIMFTLALCLITIWIIDAVKDKISNKVLWYSISIVVVGISCAVAMALSLDYDYHAIIVAYIFYIFYDKPILGAGLGYLSIIKELYSCLGFAMTVTYNGERGKQNTGINYLFYPDTKDALPLAKALVEGGLPCAEVTFRTEAAEESIRLMHEAYPDMVLAAGTVLTTEQVDRAVAAGASVIVSPGFDPEIVDYCISKNIPVMPGIVTPSELAQAVKRGLTRVKFFPATAAGGIKMIKAMCAAYTTVRIMPTGGINTSNLEEFLSCDKIFCCGGSWMVKGDLIKAGEFDKIKDMTAEAVALVKEIRSK